MDGFVWFLIAYLVFVAIFVYIFEFKIDHGSDPIANGIIAAGKALSESYKKPGGLP